MERFKLYIAEVRLQPRAAGNKNCSDPFLVLSRLKLAGKGKHSTQFRI